VRQGRGGVSGRAHMEGEGGGSARVRSCHAEDGVGGLAGCGTGRGAWPAWVGGGHPCTATRARAGDEGGSNRGGPRLGRCHGPAQAHSADFDLNKDH
jgi:hypothetical protein